MLILNQEYLLLLLNPALHQAFFYVISPVRYPIAFLQLDTEHIVLEQTACKLGQTQSPNTADANYEHVAVRLTQYTHNSAEMLYRSLEQHQIHRVFRVRLVVKHQSLLHFCLNHAVVRH